MSKPKIKKNSADRWTLASSAGGITEKGRRRTGKEGGTKRTEVLTERR